VLELATLGYAIGNNYVSLLAGPGKRLSELVYKHVVKISMSGNAFSSFKRLTENPNRSRQTVQTWLSNFLLNSAL
jgi:hypothetical protein